MVPQGVCKVEMVVPTPTGIPHAPPHVPRQPPLKKVVGEQTKLFALGQKEEEEKDPFLQGQFRQEGGQTHQVQLGSLHEQE
jgi:hypothetical protein